MSQRRNWALMDDYKNAMGDACSWPGCTGGGHNVHHIVPLSRGGLDEVQNYIALCVSDHLRRHLHRDFAQREIELATYKHMAELARFGFIIDSPPALRDALDQGLLLGNDEEDAKTCLREGTHEVEREIESAPELSPSETSHPSHSEFRSAIYQMNLQDFAEIVKDELSIPRIREIYWGKHEPLPFELKLFEIRLGLKRGSLTEERRAA